MKNQHSLKGPALALAALSLLAATIWLAVWSGGRSDAETASYSESSHYTFAWTEGQKYRYALRSRATESLTPAAKASSASVSGESSVDSELVIRSYGHRGDNYVLGFELQDCTEASVSVAGHSVVSTANDCEELLEGYELFAEVAPSGELVAVYDVESTEETRLASHFLHGIVTELGVVVRSGREWTAVQTSTRGRAVNHYQRTSNLALTRKRNAYQNLRSLPTSEASTTSVQGEATIGLASDGYLKSFRSSESISIEEEGTTTAESTSELSVEFIGTMPAARKAPVLAASSKREVGELSNATRMRTLLLEQRAGTMTQEKLLGAMASYGNGGIMPNHAQFLWSVTGFLELHPEACEPFAKLFSAADASAKQRALIADVLAQVQHPQAQRVFVAMLSTPAATADPQFIRYFQSLAVTTSPTGESVAFAMNQLTRGESSETESDQFASTAAAFVLGGMRSHLAESNPSAAKEIDTSLVAFVEDADDDMALANALRALGNSRAETHVDVYADYQDHASPTVRRSAARALGRTGSARSTALLLDMAKDENARVQGEALDALQSISISAEDLVALGDVVAAGNMHWHHHSAFIALIENNHVRIPSAAQVATEAVLVAPNLQSADARAAAYRLLERLKR